MYPGIVQGILTVITYGIVPGENKALMSSLTVFGVFLPLVLQNWEERIVRNDKKTFWTTLINGRGDRS